MSEAIYSISINLLHPLHLRVSKETPAAFIIYKKFKLTAFNFAPGSSVCHFMFSANDVSVNKFVAFFHIILLLPYHWNLNLYESKSFQSCRLLH